MKIAVASLGDPTSVATWSGIPLSIVRQLQQKGHEVAGIPLRKPREPWHYPWRRRYHHRLFGKWFVGAIEKRWLSSIARNLDQEVNEIKPDVVVVIHADWLAYASFSCPAIIVHDATFDLLLNYYPSFTNLCKRSIFSGHAMYQRALDKCAAAVFSADWATANAISRYNLPHTKGYTIPFGPNLAYTPDRNDINDWIRQRVNRKTCELLFVGTQWIRKGGPEALAFVGELNRLGIDAVLNVVGCSPSIAPDDQRFVRHFGFLRKEDPADAEIFTSLLERSHAMIVLSKAECYGCVYCEANAYALPAIGRDTGGVSEIIRPGVNGFLLRHGQTVESLAVEFASLWFDKSNYVSLALNSYKEFTDRLSLEVFGDKFESVLDQITQKASMCHE